MAALLRTSLSPGQRNEVVLGPLLEIADSAMTYRRRYFAQPQLSPVLDLLVADPTNARSLGFQLVVLTDHVKQLPRDKRAPSPTREQKIVARMISTLAAADLDLPEGPGDGGEYPRLTTLFRALEEDLRQLSDTITYYYFSHAELRVS